MTTQESPTFLLEAPDYHYGNKGSWKVYRQPSGHIVQLPIPTQDELSGYYPKTYYSFTNSSVPKIKYNGPKAYLWASYLNLKRGYKLPVKAIGLITVFASWILKSKTWLSPQLREDGTLVDFGCGSGDYLHIMKAFGWKVFGIEISKDACLVGEKNGLRIINGGVKEMGELPPASVDVIRSSHSLEHLVETELFFSNAYKALKPGGVLLIDTPNAESISFKTTGKFWYYLALPVHVNLFSATSILHSMENAGFRNIQVSTYTLFRIFVMSYLAQKKQIPSGVPDAYYHSFSKFDLFLGSIKCLIPYLISRSGNNGDNLIAKAWKPV